MDIRKFFVALNLRLFDGEGGGGEGGATAGQAAETTPGVKPADSSRRAKNPLADVKYGKQPDESKPAAPVKVEPDTQVTTDTIEARRAKFESLLAEFKDLDTERTQKMIDTRFKNTKALEGQVKEVRPLLDMLAMKYGVDGKDIAALQSAIDEDDSFFQEEADKRGWTVKEYKDYLRVKSENVALKEAEEARTRQNAADQIYAKWKQQETEAKKMYPSLDLNAETMHPETGPRFTAMLKAGVDVKAAYQVIHQDEIMSGAMQYTAQQVAQKVQADIRTRGMRPAENGVMSGSPAVVMKSDPRSLTKKDRDEIARRVNRGENISF